MSKIVGSDQDGVLVWSEVQNLCLVGSEVRKPRHEQDVVL